MSFNIADYIDVKERVKLFIKAYPEGSLRFEFKGICEHDPEYMWGIAYAYRTPDDAAPAMGTAQELAVGRTNFTRGSTMQNLETSCWGRAISALGIGIDKSIASRDEVEFAQARQSEPREYSGFTNKPHASPKQIALINKLTKDRTFIVQYWKHTKEIVGALTAPQASDLIEFLTKAEAEAKEAFIAEAIEWNNAEPDPWQT